MIEVLALDIAYLNHRRQNIIRRLFDDEFITQASDEDLTFLVAAIRSAETHDQKAFDHVIARYAETTTQPLKTRYLFIGALLVVALLIALKLARLPLLPGSGSPT